MRWILPRPHVESGPNPFDFDHGLVEIGSDSGEGTQGVLEVGIHGPELEEIGVDFSGSWPVVGKVCLGLDHIWGDAG